MFPFYRDRLRVLAATWAVIMASNVFQESIGSARVNKADAELFGDRSEVGEPLGLTEVNIYPIVFQSTLPSVRSFRNKWSVMLKSMHPGLVYFRRKGGCLNK